jgi:hypothetical protein
MANPNILGATTIYGNTTYLIPATTAATAWTALTPAANTVHKIENITVSNVTGNAVPITLSVNSSTAGGGTAYRIAYQISVPSNASLIVTDKSTSFYVTETQSVVATVGTASALELVASYEAIT